MSYNNQKYGIEPNSEAYGNLDSHVFDAIQL